MKNFFAFGCSFTNYIYPTWVDFVDLHDSVDRTYNFGASGAGNKYILTQLFYLLENYTPSEQDTLAFMFTSSPRYDWINKGDGWVLSGNMFNCHLYKELQLDEIWSTNTGVLDAYLSIKTVIELTKSLNCKTIFMSAFGPENSIGEYNTPSNDTATSDRYTDMVASFHRNFNHGANLRDLSIIHTGYTKYAFADTGPDGHPSIEDHRFWVETHMKDYYCGTAAEKAKEWENLIIKKTVPETGDTYKSIRNVIPLHDKMSQEELRSLLR